MKEAQQRLASDQRKPLAFASPNYGEVNLEAWAARAASAMLAETQPTIELAEKPS